MVDLVEVVQTKSKQVPGLGAKIMEARKQAQANGRPMTAIAAAAGMSTQNWYRIEKERQTLPLETLRIIESVLGVDFGVEFSDD